MSEAKHLPGTYLTDGRSLLWVVERLSADTMLVENSKTGEQVEMGDADLHGYKVVQTEE
jgi:hypothetical protein